MNDLNDLLSSLSEEDVKNLKAAAENIFSSANKGKASGGSGGSEEGAPDFSSVLGDASFIAKLTSIMNAVNKEDDRTRLIEALKPLLSEKRRKKADEAARLMKLIEILPTLSRLIGGDKNT